MQRRLVVVIYSLLGVIGFLGNSWVIVTVVRQLNRRTTAASTNGGGATTVANGGAGHRTSAVLRRKTSQRLNRQTSAFIYLLMLSIVDLSSVVPTPLIVLDVLFNEWIFGQFACKLFMVCEGMNKFLSPLILTALSIDRYLAICQPTHIHLRDTTAAIIVVFLCCLFSLLFVAPLYYFSNVGKIATCDNEFTIKCQFHLPDTMQTSFHAGQFVESYLVPLVLICLVYTMILIKLYRHTRHSSVGRSTTISLGRVVKCSLMVVAFYFVCWTPYWCGLIVQIVYIASAGRSGSDHGVNNTTLNGTTMFPAMPLENGFNTTVNMTSAYNSGCASVTAPDIMILVMYISHALPYAQSAFNWLFYAFLNRHLRQTARNNGGLLGNTFTRDPEAEYSQMNTLIANLTIMRERIRSAGSDGANRGSRLLRSLTPKWATEDRSRSDPQAMLALRKGEHAHNRCERIRASASSGDRHKMSDTFSFRSRDSSRASDKIGGMENSSGGGRYLTVDQGNIKAHLKRQQQMNRIIADELSHSSVDIIGAPSSADETSPGSSTECSSTIALLRCARTDSPPPDDADQTNPYLPLKTADGDTVSDRGAGQNSEPGWWRAGQLTDRNGSLPRHPTVLRGNSIERVSAAAAVANHELSAMTQPDGGTQSLTPDEDDRGSSVWL